MLQEDCGGGGGASINIVQACPAVRMNKKDRNTCIYVDYQQLNNVTNNKRRTHIFYEISKIPSL